MSTYRGTYNADGSIAEWPQRDIANNVFEKPATHFRLADSQQFVVLPPRFSDHERVFTLLVAVEAREKELAALFEAEYKENNKEAIAEEERARRTVLGSAPSVTAPVMVEPDAKASKLSRGIVANDTNAE